MPFAATWMDLENMILTVKQRKEIYDINYIWNLKNNTNEYIDKIETDLQTQKTNTLPQGKQGRDNLVKWG